MTWTEGIVKHSRVRIDWSGSLVLQMLWESVADATLRNRKSKYKV